MPDIPQLVAAKAELAASPAGSQTPGVAVDAIANASQRRTAPPGVTPRRRQQSTRKRTPTVTRPRAGGGVVQAESLERLLADTPAGLSANAVAKRADVGYARTLKLLHDLEAAGQVRRSGSRRSTVWQVITDEERIAQRAAELERQRTTPSRPTPRLSARS
jgi:hypothetical protein